mmetsp:Transcript_12623/g.18420  ORF Transcript_12623/g.18420 Transcript_12623/m.18420 type:complete len:114 (+) Transcript_12623:212-553(+)
MSFFTKIGKFFGGSAAAVAKSSATKSRSVARDRLSVILASQRGSELLEGVDMELLQRDVMEVVQRHIKLAKKSKPANFQVRSEGEVSLFEMSVELERQRSKIASASIPKPADS